MLQISDGLLFLMVYTVVLDCCILLVFDLCFCLEYLEGGRLTGQSRFTFVVFKYTANVSLILVCRAQLHTYYDIPLLGSKGGWRALATKNIYYIMATQNSLMIDRKRSRPDITTTDFNSAQICSWPRFLLIKGTNDERPLYKLSTFAVNKVIVAVLGSDPFNIKKLRNGSILVEVDKETQS